MHGEGNHVVLHGPFGYLTFTPAIIISVTLAVIIAFSLMTYLTRNLKIKPNKKQIFAESIVGFVQGIIKDNMSWEKGVHFVSLGVSLLLFIVVSNIMGLIMIIRVDGVTLLQSPTATMSVTFALTAMVISLTHYYGLKVNGIKGYLKGYTKPVSWLTPLNIFEEITNFLTLWLRLFGNIFAGEILIDVILVIATTLLSFGGIIAIGGTALSFVVMIGWLGFSVFVGLIQAYVFTMLTMMYMGHKIQSMEEH